MIELPSPDVRQPIAQVGPDGAMRLTQYGYTLFDRLRRRSIEMTGEISDATLTLVLGGTPTPAPDGFGLVSGNLAGSPQSGFALIPDAQAPRGCDTTLIAVYEPHCDDWSLI